MILRQEVNAPLNLPTAVMPAVGSSVRGAVMVWERSNGVSPAVMDREQVLARLRAHEQELKGAGIISLSLFGSVARGVATEQSDIDLIGDFDRAKRLTLFDLAGLEVRLADILETRVDLADRRMLKDPVRVRAEREAILAFW